ncbi:hypothetical protein ACE1B6_22415 [Aerosakkonemataceae cyanobacterium BLCC-F154]|uniref:Uncharacterized protein n=1 Tax=Floridaenema fluviatile BLCC-F154 TaxID=3153640 RepID=A0ABV4YHN7_9CYAN
MVMRLSSSIAALTLTAATSLFATTAKAQVGVDCTNGIDCVNPFPLSVYTLDEAMNRAYYNNGKPVYQNQVFPRQLYFIFGPSWNLLQGNYPEIEITEDGRTVHNLYVEAMRLQNTSDPVIRTRNLPNPYNTSVLLLLPDLIERPVPGVELYNQELPPQ